MSVLPTYDEALRRLFEAVEAFIPPCRPGERPELPIRRRPLRLAAGAILAEPIRADRDLPPFDRATMDGYALSTTSLAPGAGFRLRVTATISAGQTSSEPLAPGCCAAIATGAPLPPGADAVVPHELTDRGAPFVTIRAPGIAPWAHVHLRGADAHAGELLIDKGETLDPVRVALAAAVGAVRPLIRGGVPSLRILSSGDEIKPADTPTPALASHDIRDSGAAALEALIPLMGARIESYHHLPDDLPETRRAVVAALPEADILLTIGGLSAGQRDHFPAAFSHADLAPLFQGVNIQPGKPVCFGIGSPLPPYPLPSSASEPTFPPWRPIVLGLPGNPVSVMVTAHLFLWPLIRVLSGLSGDLPWRPATLAEPMTPNPRRESFRPASLDHAGLARVIPWHGSGDLVHLLRSSGLLRIAPREEPLPSGAALNFLPWVWNLPSPGHAEP